jgi:hypothetical protein
MKKSMILGAAAALLMAGAAQAQQPVRRGADADGDHRISLQEMQVKAAERFARMDANRDGRLTREERQAARTQLRAEREQRRGDPAQRFARRDADRDGFLNPAEAGPRLAPHFAHLDADRNGRLSPAEVQAGRQILRGERRQAHAADAPGRARADANRDGVITRPELDAQVFARFTRLDVNRDGFLTREERRAGRGPRRAG